MLPALPSVDALLQSLRNIDTLTEWEMAILGVIVIVVGISLGNWVWPRILQGLFILLYLSVTAIPLFLVANGILQQWQDVVFSCLVIGFLGSIPLLPFFAVSSIQRKIDGVKQQVNTPAAPASANVNASTSKSPTE